MTPLKICLLLAIIAITPNYAQSQKELVEQTIDTNKIKSHIYFLADDLLKGRETGTPENKIAAAYLANQLRSYGVKPNPKTDTFYQEVVLEKMVPPSNLEISLNATEFLNAVAINSTAINYIGDAVFLNYGLEEDYKGKDVKGKLIVVKAGSAGTKDVRAAFRLRTQKEELAKSNGVIGVIEFLNVQDEMWSYVDHNFNTARLNIDKDAMPEQAGPFSYVWIQDKDNVQIDKLSTTKKIAATLTSDGQQTSQVLSQNVIGIVEGTDAKLKDEFIIYSAHYDHVGIGKPDETGDTIYNGARDNAVGTTTVLSMAEHLAKHPTKRSALFILFTGEEKGLLGSEYYVEHPIVPLKQMVYCFNSDNAGYNDTSLATIIGLPRTTAEKHIKEAATAFGITAVDDPAPEQGLFDRSDNVHFAKKGIPAPTFSLGFNAFNGDVTKYYHRPGDEANTLDYDYLGKFFKAYVLAGTLIGNDPKTPVWVADDPYENAGKALYGN